MQSRAFNTVDLLFAAVERYVHEIKSLTMSKVMVIMCVSGFLMVVQQFVNTYLFHDWSYLISLFILIGIDTITGFIKAMKQGVVSSTRFGSLFVKVFLYCMVLITINVLISFKVNGSHPVIFDWLEVFIFTALMFREAISIFENTAIIYPSLLPKYVMTKLETFDGIGFRDKMTEVQEAQAGREEDIRQK
jgi:small basic protein